MKLDLLIKNANIHTMSELRPNANSVAIHDGKIVALDDEIPAGVTFQQIMDLDGASVIPGFNDAHAHSTWFGLSLMEVNLADARTALQVYERIETKAATLAADEWVIAAGFSPLLLEGPELDRDQLDRAAGGRPVWIKHSSGHAAHVNGVALQRIAERNDLSEPITGGVVVRDASGRVTGLLEETAMQLVRDLVLPYSSDTIVQALDLATAHYVKEGLTSVTDAGIGGGWIGYSPNEFAAYQAALERGKLRTRMQPMVVLDALESITGHAEDGPLLGLRPGVRSGLGNEHLSIGPVKIFTDGSLLGTTAYMHEDYVGCPGNHGYLQMPPEDLRDAALAAASAGWALALHAIGDRAIDHAIDIIAEARSRFGQRALPDRIEHGGVVSDHQLDAMGKHGIALVPQPHFITEFGDGMSRVLGEERAALSYPARRALDHGVVLPGSSDRPVSEGRPLSVIQAFIDRKPPSGTVYGPNERLTVMEAFRAYSVGSARATGFAGVKGELVAGQLADLAVLSDDPLTSDPHSIAQIQVVATMVGGQIVYGHDSISFN